MGRYRSWAGIVMPREINRFKRTSYARRIEVSRYDDRATLLLYPGLMKAGASAGYPQRPPSLRLDGAVCATYGRGVKYHKLPLTAGVMLSRVFPFPYYPRCVSLCVTFRLLVVAVLSFKAKRYVKIPLLGLVNCAKDWDHFAKIKSS